MAPGPSVLASLTMPSALTVLPWALLAVGSLGWWLFRLTAPQWQTDWTTIAQSAFFVVIIARLVISAVRQPDRRPTLLTLTGALVLFAVGSSLVNTTSTPDHVTFPAPGELFFLASYAAIAAYLMLDANRTVDVAGVRWLEAAVICGGCVCVAGSLLVTTASTQLQQDGLSLLLAVLYPLLDIVLAFILLAQVAVRVRAGRDALPAMAGFALLACADVGFLFHLGSGAYDFSYVSMVVWGAGLGLIVDNASRRRPVIEQGRTSYSLSVPISLAGMAAAFVLAFGPSGSVRIYILVPALATLAAAGARLVLALRAATRASDAIRLSRSDDLTDLPNRRAVRERLESTLSTTDHLGLMIIDLNGFKDINDTLGHAAGDTVLCEVATRVRAAVDSSVMVARLGGDEFAVVAPTEDEIELMEMAQTIHAAANQPMIIEGITLSVGASIGVTTRQVTDLGSGELLRRADIAMYEAKRRRLTAAVYDADSDEFSRDRLSLADELRQAIDNGEIVLWYQPQYDALGRGLAGLEALMRWRHPVRGLLSPAMFLPVARHSGLMQALSDELARIAVRDLLAWQINGFNPQVAVNCAPPELMTGLFVSRLVQLLDEAGLSPERVTIEVTEDSFLAEPERAREQMLAIRRHGFQLSVDDYGSGFSSLAYLRDLPIQELKIDRSFITAVASEPRSRMIVASTTQMASALGLRTVAEGVETADTASTLASLGADVLQGYHLGRPVPPEEVWDAVSAMATSSVPGVAKDS